MGVKLSLALSEILKPQRLMGLHIIKDTQINSTSLLRHRRGRVKSAAILWQRVGMAAASHASVAGEKVKIIYAHSQVAQMVEVVFKDLIPSTT
jgi:hypothetical protein